MLNIVQITDLHLRGTPHSELRGIDVDAGLAAVLAHIRAHHWPLDALLATGDLAHEDAAGYDRLRDWLAPLGVPVYCLPGNHDLPDFASLLAAGPIRRERRVQLGGWQIVLLNSALPGEDSGLLAGDELAFLDECLAAAPQQPALVAVHHHPEPTGVAWLDRVALTNPADLWAVLDRHRQVRGVVWGHIHRAWEGRRHGMALMGTPSTCCQFTAEGEPEALARPGYRWLRLGRDGSLASGIERVAVTSTCGRSSAV